MRKLRNSAIALTTVAALSLGGNAVALADNDPADGSNNTTNTQQENPQDNQQDTQQGKQKSSSQNGSSQGKGQKGSVNPAAEWTPNDSFGSTLHTNNVPMWAKIWMGVVGVVAVITAGLFVAPGITAMRMHNILP